MSRTINFTGYGANVVGSLGSGSLVQDMPVTWANYDFLNQSTKDATQIMKPIGTL